ncbi:hypothetical protein MoryE10_07060 [Methylogaea oryzae]|uniref:Tyr recombinase domain-containing protein n=1 Tax=Methylogaea oryzae TaxID=1295382 RepID=A0A8D4VLN7_9GAMM|nr:hypothetical protein MoryE10_07060 [Methylogaea oryzae]
MVGGGGATGLAGRCRHRGGAGVPRHRQRRPGGDTLSDKSVGELVKAYAGRAGLNPAEFGGHSLRAGFVTSAAEAGASIFKMAD